MRWQQHSDRTDIVMAKRRKTRQAIGRKKMRNKQALKAKRNEEKERKRG